MIKIKRDFVIKECGSDKSEIQFIIYDNAGILIKLATIADSSEIMKIDE